jgi:uncharacterized protein YndB with AHSA1/START domain
MEKSASSDFVITRVFNAPRNRVWGAWTEREQLMQWFGPEGFTMPVAKLDFRPGGVFHYALRAPDDAEIWGKWVFKEIVAPHKLVMITSFSDAQGGVTRHPMAPVWPLETLSTTTLEEQGGKTVLTIHWSPLHASELEINTFVEGHSSMQQGWGGTLEKLTAYLASN